MKEELLQQIKDLIETLKKENIPAIFLAFNEDHFINVKNCKFDTVAQLLVNQIESSDQMNEAFVMELEVVTKREIETLQKQS